MRLQLYGYISSALSVALIANAFYKREYHFFASLIHLTQNPVTILVLLNWALFIAFVSAQHSLHLFFGDLRVIEVEHLYERSWLAIMDTCLAMTIFRDEFNLKFIFLFASLLYLKVFHWIIADRVDFMEQSTEITFKFQVTILSILGFLGIVDAISLGFTISSILVHGPDMMIVFAFELSMLLASILTIFGKFTLHSIDFQRQEPWEEKSQYVFYIDLAFDLVKMTVYIAFFIVVVKNYGLPLHIIRDVYVTVRGFIEKCKILYQSRIATLNMRTKYPNATLEELNASDSVCIICREDMALPPLEEMETSLFTPKKLTCGHLFHFRCLKSWLERQQTCPTCRRPILQEEPTPPVQQEEPLAPQQDQQPLAHQDQIPEFKNMQDFLSHIRKLAGPQQEDQEQTIRLTPLVPPSLLKSDAHATAFNTTEPSSSSYRPLSQEDSNSDPKRLLLEKVRELQSLQSRVSLVLNQVSSLLESTSTAVESTSNGQSHEQEYKSLDKGKGKRIE